MTKKEHINYWLKSAEHDLRAAENLFGSKHYDWCLFIAHLVLEKILKAFWVRDNNSNIPPKIHKLDKIAEQTNLKLNDQQNKFLIEINDFNLETRYPDHKLKFYKVCNKKFTNNYFQQIKELYSWLRRSIK